MKGNGCITINENTEEVCPGDIYAIKKGCDFSIRLDEDMAYSYIAFKGFRADELMERIGASEKSFVFSDHRDIIDFWMTCFYKSDNGNLDLFSEAALLFTVANLSKKNKNKSELSERITEYINDKRISYAKHLLRTTSLQIQTVSLHCGIMDVHYFSKLFKQKTGKTPSCFRAESISEK